MTFHGCMDMLDHARCHIERVSPAAAHAEQQGGQALLIDLRTDTHRAEAGVLPGALCIDLTILPWRLDPHFAWRIPEATSLDKRYILACRHGYSSSIAAWQLQQMGLTNVADIIGGVEAWGAAGLPLSSGPADIRN